MDSRKLRTYTGDRLEVVDEILSLLVSRPVTLEVERREAGLFVLKGQHSKSKCSDRQTREAGGTMHTPLTACFANSCNQNT